MDKVGWELIQVPSSSDNDVGTTRTRPHSRTSGPGQLTFQRTVTELCPQLSPHPHFHLKPPVKISCTQFVVRTPYLNQGICVYFHNLGSASCPNPPLLFNHYVNSEIRNLTYSYYLGKCITSNRFTGPDPTEESWPRLIFHVRCQSKVSRDTSRPSLCTWCLRSLD